MAEIDDFDLDRSTAQAWAEFTGRLAEVISMIDESADLTIRSFSASTGPPFVRLSSPARLTIRAEAAANPSLGPSYQLTEAQTAAMEHAGWRPPDQDCPNFSRDSSQDAADELAEVVVGALRDVYGVQHPVFLDPDQLAEILRTEPSAIEGPNGATAVATGTLLAAPDGRGSALERTGPNGRGVAMIAVLPADRDHLDALVESELGAAFGHPPIRDEEGDIVIRVGSTLVFLRTAADAQDVVLFSAVVHDVAGGRSRATEVLNDLNVESRWVKFQLVRDRVFVITSVPARPFVPAHLHQAVQVMSDVADGVDDELAAKLGGRTTFGGDA
ncbi:MAG TPA: YbjN domain-containing protein [Microlunatus sp.]|nr:YbjN domain-containing protein [Microlunatus sp.]